MASPLPGMNSYPDMPNAALDDSPVALAQRLFQTHYTSCFWHLQPDLRVTDAMIPLIVKGLRTHGGPEGMRAADRLLNL